MKKAFLLVLCGGAFLGSGANVEVMCTMEYAPVCGKVHVQCVKAPCEPILQTFSNRCMLEANKLATFMWTGECENPQQTCWKTIDGRRVRVCNRLPRPEECPRFTPPSPSFCPDGVIVDGGTDLLGCPLPPRCEKRKSGENHGAESCLRLGGKWEAKQTPGGKKAACVFPDGTVCEEDSLFHGECQKKRSLLYDENCVIYFDGCTPCVVENGIITSCIKKECAFFTGEQRCLIDRERANSLDVALNKVFLKYRSYAVKERAIKRFIQILQKKMQSFSAREGEHENVMLQGIYQFLQWRLEKMLQEMCFTQGGKFTVLEKEENIYMCSNKKAGDAGKKCTSNEQCSTLCLAPGRCAPAIIPKGCFDVLKDGKKVKMCID